MSFTDGLMVLTVLRNLKEKEKNGVMGDGGQLGVWRVGLDLSGLGMGGRGVGG